MNSLWSGLADDMRCLKVEPLLVVRLQVGLPTVIGRARGTTRRVAVVDGGRFESTIPELSGFVHAGGNDWVVEDDNHNVFLDARIVLEPADGAKITMAYQGIRHGRPEVLARLRAGEEVDPSEYYFRIYPTFMTASKKFDWLNKIVCVGKGSLGPGGPTYSLFQVL